MSDISQPFGSEVDIDFSVGDADIYDSEAEAVNAAINERDQLGFLLPSYFQTEGDLRLFELRDDKVTEEKL